MTPQHFWYDKIRYCRKNFCIAVEKQYLDETIPRPDPIPITDDDVTAWWDHATDSEINDFLTWFRIQFENMIFIYDDPDYWFDVQTPPFDPGGPDPGGCSGCGEEGDDYDGWC